MAKQHIFDLTQNAPEGINPYSLAMQALEKMEKPPFGHVFRSALTAFSLIHAATCLCCVAILVIPFFQGEVGGAQHNWILRRKYLGKHGTPYFILNNGLVIGTSLFSWIEILKLPGACATFIQAFTMLFISASQHSNITIRKYFIPPAIFNSLVIGFPVFVTVASIFLIAHKAGLIHKQDLSYQTLTKLFTDAIFLWDGGQKILSDSQKDLLKGAYEVFTTDTFLKNQSRILIGLFWAFVDIPSIVLYVGCVCALVTTVYQSITTPHKLRPKIIDPEESIQGPIVMAKESPRPLARSLRFLWLHYLSMSVALSMDAATGLFFYLNKNNLKDRRLVATFFITNLSSSIFTLIAIIIMLIRIIGDGKEAQKSARVHTGESLQGSSFDSKMTLRKEESM
ncbi:hypothetical protein PSTG_07007 [Puccinia striiformis f. sp. tritici PST-78]|uniref:Uncharacterized protein n=1 Tax=Puccinia striiformis f. sp. tritici PST-78 TaxID=1165861 RepID=A0A0L0VKB2_9BASI|nr:hypothetical protein PSTG_07007 [Puccinia striiformis f. sp. tritici PST-78]